MKDKITVHLRRKANGEVIGNILNEKGVVIASTSFGAMTDAEYEKGMQHVKEQFPDAAIWLLVDVDTGCDDIGF